MIPFHVHFALDTEFLMEAAIYANQPPQFLNVIIVLDGYFH